MAIGKTERGCLLAAALCLLPLHVYADDLAENQARFGEITGTVQVLSQGAVDWIDANIDLPLEVGDQVRVDEDSTAELSIAKNVLLFLDAGTQVIIGHTTTREGKISIQRGAVLGKVEPLAAAPGEWQFETPVGVCAVRGTEFTLVHSEEEGTHLGVMKGAVEMRPAETAAGPLPLVMVNANEEGVLEKHKPFRKLNSFSPIIRRQQPHAVLLQKRFHRVAGVWSPLTREYRQELRRKYVTPPKSRKHIPPRPADSRRRPPPPHR